MLFAEFWTFSLFCALALSKAGARVVMPTLFCSSENTNRTCEDILEDEIPSPPCPDAESPQGNIFNSSIDYTQPIQPSITLTVNSSTFDEDKFHNSGWSGYVVGYKDCTSNHGYLCYIYLSQLPDGFKDDYVHIVNPVNPDSESEGSRVSVGDQCSFFGCFVYREEKLYDKSCEKEVRGAIFEPHNVTIMAACDTEHSVGNGSIGFAIPQDRTQFFIEGTVANVTCDEGFAATYGGVSECQSDGTWNTTSLPTCERQCGELNMIVDDGIAKISDETRIVNTTITVTCYDGYYLSEENTLTCGEDGNWNTPSLSSSSCLPLKCRDPDIRNATTWPLPVDGGYYYLANTSVTVTCDEGYAGGGNITCGTDGNWTSPVPLCSIIECPELDAKVDNGKVIVNRPYNWEYWNVQERHVPVRTVMSVTCDWSYTGDDSIVCGNDGNWSASLPSCSKDHLPEIIIGIVIPILTLLITAILFMLIFYKYRTYRNNKIRRFNRYFTIQARKESLDPNFAPIDLNPHTKLSISLSIRTTNEYYEITADSVATPMTTTPLHGGVVELTKSQSVDNVSNLPLGHTNRLATTEPYIKDTDSVSAEPTNRSCSSLPYTLYTQHEKADAGTIATEPSKNGEEHADIAFHLSDSSSGVQSGKGVYIDHSCIGFEFTDTQSSSVYPVSSHKPSYEPCPEESTGSCFTFDVDIPESKVHSTTPPDNPDSAITEGQTDTTPHYEGGYTNIPESITPLSPETPSAVTLAFATVGQPAGIQHSNMSISDSASQLESFEPEPPYVNSCHSGSSYLGQYTIESASSYIGESTTTGYVAESSVAKSSTGYTGGSSVDISSSEYVSEDLVGEGNYPSHGYLSYAEPGSQYRGTPSSTYLTEYDLCNSNDHMPTEPLPNDTARLPGTTQPTTDHETSSARQMNSGLPGYVALPNTSSTA